MEQSQLRPFSIALVSSIKDLKSNKIVAIPIELRMGSDEEIVEGNNPQNAAFATRGGEDNIAVVTSNSIPATWMKRNSNRVTAPDVRRGDQVMLYRLGETDTYYWEDFNCKNVKRLETVIWAFSADPQNPMNEDLSNAYFIEWSSHNKTVTLHTSQANGEPFGYDFQLNTDDGIYRILDTAGNTTWVDSANTCIGFKNAAGTWLHLDKKNMNGYAPDSMSWTAVNNINFKCKDFKIDASNSYTLNTTTYACTATESIKLSTNSFMSTSQTNLFKCPKSTFTGDVVAANISVGSGAKGGGNCEVAGALTAKSISCTSFNAKKGHINSFTHDGGKCC